MLMRFRSEIFRMFLSMFQGLIILRLKKVYYIIQCVDVFILNELSRFQK